MSNLKVPPAAEPVSPDQRATPDSFTPDFSETVSVIAADISASSHSASNGEVSAHASRDSKASASTPVAQGHEQIEVASKLKELVISKFPGQPVHLVAHSMGGLVSRNFIRRHPDVWQGMRACAFCRSTPRRPNGTTRCLPRQQRFAQALRSVR